MVGRRELKKVLTQIMSHSDNSSKDICKPLRIEEDESCESIRVIGSVSAEEHDIPNRIQESKSFTNTLRGNIQFYCQFVEFGYFLRIR